MGTAACLKAQASCKTAMSDGSEFMADHDGCRSPMDYYLDVLCIPTLVLQRIYIADSLCHRDESMSDSIRDA